MATEKTGPEDALAAEKKMLQNMADHGSLEENGQMARAIELGVVKVDSRKVPFEAIDAVFRVKMDGDLTLGRLASFVRAAYSVGADEETEVFPYWADEQSSGYGSPVALEVFVSILPKDDLLNAHRIEI